MKTEENLMIEELMGRQPTGVFKTVLLAFSPAAVFVSPTEPKKVEFVCHEEMTIESLVLRCHRSKGIMTWLSGDVFIPGMRWPIFDWKVVDDLPRGPLEIVSHWLETPIHALKGQKLEVEIHTAVAQEVMLVGSATVARQK